LANRGGWDHAASKLLRRNIMQSLEEQYGEVRQALLDSKKCVEADLKQFTSLATMEERLSRIKTFAKSKGIKESRPRITRNNGSGTVVTESDQEQRIRKHMERTRCSWKEASIFMTGSAIPEPTSDKKSLLAEAWHRYSKALTPAECETLAARNVPVPTR
jgi:hypothetical protein